MKPTAVLSAASALAVALVVVPVLTGATTALVAGPAAEREGAAAHHRVEIRNLAFVPDSLRVAPGDTITWTNRDLVPHTVTGSGRGRAAADRGALGTLAPAWTSERLDEGESFTWVVPEAAGALPYLCSYHPVMVGVLQILDM